MNELTEQEVLRTLWYAAWLGLADSVAPEQASSHDAWCAASAFLSSAAATDAFARGLLLVLPELAPAFHEGWSHYAHERRQEVWQDELVAHLSDLNFFCLEQVKYGNDAYDQRNGQRWFLDAMQRVQREMNWFAHHDVVVFFNAATQQYEVKP